MLIIDSRENSMLSKLVMQKAHALQIKHEKRWIEIGDYVYDDIFFEAKSATDFLGSVMSKRLWTQLDNMDRCYKTHYRKKYLLYADKRVLNHLIKCNIICINVLKKHMLKSSKLCF